MNQIAAVRTHINQVLDLGARSLDQIKEQFSKDIVLVVGDFNVNALSKPLPSLFELEEPLANKWMKNLQGGTFMEYDFLVSTLSSFGKHEIVDLKRVNSVNGQKDHPITFGQTEISPSG